MYVSQDEPSAHVAPGPGGTRRFRLLLAAWRYCDGATSQVAARVAERLCFANACSSRLELGLLGLGALTATPGG
jgi:hypothetical protein